MFGDNLKRYRVQKKYSQAEIAEKLYVTRQCVSKWEKGITEPDLETLSRISELLEVPIDILLARNGEVIAGNSKPDFNRALFIAHVLLAVFCVLAFFSLWRFLPPHIPAHWTDGVIDRYGSSAEVFFNLITVAVFLAVDTVTFVLARKSGANGRIAIAAHSVILVFQSANFIFIFVLYAKYAVAVFPFVTCISACIILSVSVAMHPKISKRNLWLGLRTRETLSNETVWRKANALACYLFVGVSLAVLAINFVFVSVWSGLALLAYPLSVAVPTVYAKRLYKKLS